ncbi:MAG: hypothetical protein JSV30_03255 [Candidatus Omnitrophota bacterium]|nr:MAG: hypothetical protein JSV30_03255 [Candidatus Omnitrophota bacterium]
MNIRKYLNPFWLCAILLGVSFLFCCRISADNDDWNIEKSKHFIIYYRQAPSDYISEVRRRAERYYRTITDYLGFRRFNFWTWEERCKIYLYPNREAYLKESGSVPWSRGKVHITKKEIVTYVKKEQFLDYVLPHELGHIIFKEVVGFDKKLPLWISEAVAVLQEKDRQRYLRFARELVKEKRYISLEELSRFRDYKQISPQAFYSQSASIIEFLLNNFGRDDFVVFCRRLRDGEEWKEALLKTYKFENLKALQEAWARSF